MGQEEHRSAQTSAWGALIPAATVAVGPAEHPVDRLLTLQSAIARGVRLIAMLGWLRPKPRLNGLPRFRFR